MFTSDIFTDRENRFFNLQGDTENNKYIRSEQEEILTTFNPVVLELALSQQEQGNLG